MVEEDSPVFRRAITPWYHSRVVHALVLIAMLAVFLFAAAGLQVVRQEAAYRPYAWVPILLMFASGALVVTSAVRLFRR